MSRTVQGARREAEEGEGVGPAHSESSGRTRCRPGWRAARPPGCGAGPPSSRRSRRPPRPAAAAPTSAARGRARRATGACAAGPATRGGWRRRRRAAPPSRSGRPRAAGVGARGCPRRTPRVSGTARSRAVRSRRHTSGKTVPHSARTSRAAPARGSPTPRRPWGVQSSRRRRRSGVGSRGTPRKPFGARAGESDPGQFAGLAEQHITGLPDRPELGVGAVQRLDLPPAREEREQRVPQPQHRPGAEPRAALEDRAEHREVQRDLLDRRPPRPAGCSSITMNSIRPLSDAAVTPHQVEGQPVRTPRHEAQQRPRLARRRPRHSTITHCAVGRVAEPAERHREAALGAAPSRQCVGRAPAARPSRRPGCRRAAGSARCSRPASPGCTPAGPCASRGPSRVKSAVSTIASSPSSRASRPCRA